MRIIFFTFLFSLTLITAAFADRSMGELIKEAQDNFNHRATSIDDKIKYLTGQLNEEMLKVNDLKAEINDLKKQKNEAKAELKARLLKIKTEGAPQ